MPIHPQAPAGAWGWRPRIKNIAEGPYFMVTYQLGWRHLVVKIHQTFSDQPKLVSELIDFLYSGHSWSDQKNTASYPTYNGRGGMVESPNH